jgi:hypothetical protein
MGHIIIVFGYRLKELVEPEGLPEFFNILLHFLEDDRHVAGKLIASLLTREGESASRIFVRCRLGGNKSQRSRSHASKSYSPRAIED